MAEEGALGMPWGDMDEAPPAGLAGPRPANLDLAEGDLFVLRLLGGSDPSPVAFVRGGKLLEHQLKHGLGQSQEVQIPELSTITQSTIILRSSFREKMTG